LLFRSSIIKYAGEIRKNNFPSKLFIIDDKWTSTYGDPEFDPKKFPDPEKMISFLHQNDFRIALWLTPFIEKKAQNYKYASDHHYLIMDPESNSPYLTEWWNGTAALVDLSNPEARLWFLGFMENLRKKYGVDGFKLDAGDAEYLEKPFISYGSITANEYADLFAGLGTSFEANELRVSWRAQSMGLIQRLRDKAPSWGAVDGLNSLIPHAMAAGLMGYSYVCPDMIGGGLDSGFKNKGYKLDEELFVRWTEASALMPMMQYSLAPWKLAPENAAICRKYSDLHVSLGEYIYKLALQSRNDGTPIVRPLFFEFPSDEKTYLIKDEFMLGDRFLVAPVLEKGAVTRKIYLPESTWIDLWTGRIFKGGQTADYHAPLDVLPVLIRIE
jgi:alpha-glucosidase (family GH31 glycosyl hydrolase)